MQLLLLEVLNPFYIFQVFSIIIWCLEVYYWYAGAIFLMSASGVIISITQIRKVLPEDLIYLILFQCVINFFILFVESEKIERHSTR